VVAVCQVKALLSLADACEPAAIRCRILQELPLVRLMRNDRYQEGYEFEHYYAGVIESDLIVLPPEYASVALAAVTVRFLLSTRRPIVCGVRERAVCITHLLTRSLVMNDSARTPGSP
jgi:hypothetical protein